MANIERLCQICFIRENMLLATLLDSVCINNMQNLPRDRRMVFGKLQATLSLFLQDFPQLVIHLIFLFAWDDDNLHHNVVVELSLAVSFIAICVSLFNFIMFKPNEFDPILLEYELKKRRDWLKILPNSESETNDNWLKRIKTVRLQALRNMFAS
jgi:hypothetical protein